MNGDGAATASRVVANGCRAMKHSDTLMLLDRDGTLLDTRIVRVLTQLRPRLRRLFPELQDEVTVTDVLERAGRRIAVREQQRGPIEKLHGYAWVTMRSVATSEMRRSSGRLLRRTLESEAGRAHLALVPAVTGSPEEVEREILLSEVLKMLSPEERLICVWKKAGFSSQQIAKHQGRSVAAVDTLFSRAKRKLRQTFNTGTDRRRMKLTAHSPDEDRASKPQRHNDGSTGSTA